MHTAQPLDIVNSIKCTTTSVQKNKNTPLLWNNASERSKNATIWFLNTKTSAAAVARIKGFTDAGLFFVLLKADSPRAGGENDLAKIYRSFR